MTELPTPLLASVLWGPSQSLFRKDEAFLLRSSICLSRSKTPQLIQNSSHVSNLATWLWMMKRRPSWTFALVTITAFVDIVTNSLTPVSYTHLDVYKRQILASSASTP